MGTISGIHETKPDKGDAVTKAFALFFIPIAAAMGTEYFAKAEPYELRTVASNVAGLIVRSDETFEGRVLGKEPYIRIDDELDRIELEKTRAKIALLQESLGLNEKMAGNYEEMIAKKASNYDRVKSLQMRSEVEKDRDLYDLLGSRNQLLALYKENANLSVQINDLQMLERRLQRSISDKRFEAPGYVLYELMVDEEQVVNPGTPLARIADVSKAKLTIYLDPKDHAGAASKVVYLDGKRTPYRIGRLWDIADTTHLSSYRAEIIIDAPEAFSRLVKVELKDE